MYCHVNLTFFCEVCQVWAVNNWRSVIGVGGCCRRDARDDRQSATVTREPDATRSPGSGQDRRRPRVSCAARRNSGTRSAVPEFTVLEYILQHSKQNQRNGEEAYIKCSNRVNKNDKTHFVQARSQKLNKEEAIPSPSPPLPYSMPLHFPINSSALSCFSPSLSLKSRI